MFATPHMAARTPTPFFLAVIRMLDVQLKLGHMLRASASTLTTRSTAVAEAAPFNFVVAILTGDGGGGAWCERGGNDGTSSGGVGSGLTGVAYGDAMEVVVDEGELDGAVVATEQRRLTAMTAKSDITFATVSGRTGAAATAGGGAIVWLAPHLGLRSPAPTTLALTSMAKSDPLSAISPTTAASLSASETPVVPPVLDLVPRSPSTTIDIHALPALVAAHLLLLAATPSPGLMEVGEGRAEMISMGVALSDSFRAILIDGGYLHDSGSAGGARPFATPFAIGSRDMEAGGATDGSTDTDRSKKLAEAEGLLCMLFAELSASSPRRAAALTVLTNLFDPLTGPSDIATTVREHISMVTLVLILMVSLSLFLSVSRARACAPQPLAIAITDRPIHTLSDCAERGPRYVWLAGVAHNQRATPTSHATLPGIGAVGGRARRGLSAKAEAFPRYSRDRHHSDYRSWGRP